MTVRKATIDDLDVICNMAIKFALHSPYKDHIEEDTIRDLIEGILESNETYGVVFLNEDQENIPLGIVIGIIHPFIYGTKTIATELAWYVDPTQRGNRVGTDLLQAFEEWAQHKGADLITMISLDDTMGKYYQRKGYSLYERAYMKELK